MHGMKPIYGAPDFPSQQKRGEAYARDLDDFYNAKGNNGDHYILGIDFWELVDNPHEKTNWGLLTPHDNAYDGKEAVRAAGKDAWGFSTGGEDQDYGDFISYVRAPISMFRSAWGATWGARRRLRASRSRNHQAKCFADFSQPGRG